MSSRSKAKAIQLDVALRRGLKPSDLEAVRSLVAETGRFSNAEVAVAVELVDERLEQGADCGYWFSVAESGGQFIGYACFGPIPCTIASFDLYWIAVHPSCQGSGVGRFLLDDVERQIAEAGGTRIYVDTSGRDAYAPTRAFYERMGYARAAVLEDFYAPGDGKVIYVKEILKDSVKSMPLST